VYNLKYSYDIWSVALIFGGPGLSSAKIVPAAGTSHKSKFPRYFSNPRSLV
jgi:hypothetical protein